MPSHPAPDNSLKAKIPLRRAFTPAPSVSKEFLPAKSAESVNLIPFSVLNFGISDDGDEVDLHFSDRRFTFPTQWLYLSRKSEGLPAPNGCKNPSKIRANCVKTTGVGIRTTVDITWNTGTTSQFPALWLRVSGPTKALEQDRGQSRLPVPGGRNPRSGVGQLTLDERSVAERYREMLVETMKRCMDEEWLLQAETSLLREMVRFVEGELKREDGAELASGAEATHGAPHSSDEDSLIDEEEMG